MSGKKYLLPAVGAAVLMAGGAAAYLYLKGPAKDGTSPLAIARTIPDEAYAAAFISSDMQAWSKLQEFGTPEAQKLISEGLKEFEQQLLTKNNINFEKDLKPWVGNSMIAVLPSAKGKGEEPSVLAVIGIKDKISATQFALKMATQSGGKSKEEDYKGNKIIIGSDNSTYASVLKDYLLIATDKNTLQEAINTTQGQPSLASKPGAEELLTKGVDVKNPIAQVYMMDYADTIQKLMNTSSSEVTIPPSTLKQIKNLKSFVVGIGVEDAGVRMKGVVNMSPDAPKLSYKPVPGKVVSQFPAETLAMVSGGNISQSWTQGLEQVKDDPDTQKALNEIRQTVKTTVDVDLDKDVFSWMDGEFGMALIPSDRGILAQVGFGGIFVFDTSDRKTAEATLSKLDKLAKENSVLIQERDVQGKKVTEWNSPFGSLLGHGWLDDDSMFIALGGPMIDVATSKPNQPLENSDNFKAIAGNLPKQNLGYFYVDMDKTMTLVNRFSALAQTPIPPEPAAVLNSIKGIGMTSTQAGDSSGQFDMLLALKKTK